VAEIWPPAWLTPEMKELVIDFIAALPIEALQRKWVYYEWCMTAGVEMLAVDVERVTGKPAGSL